MHREDSVAQHNVQMVSQHSIDASQSCPSLPISTVPPSPAVWHGDTPAFPARRPAAAFRRIAQAFRTHPVQPVAATRVCWSAPSAVLDAAGRLACPRRNYATVMMPEKLICGWRSKRRLPSCEGDLMLARDWPLLSRCLASSVGSKRTSIPAKPS